MTIDIDEYGERRICDECICDPYLAKQIEDSGKESECFYCRQDLQTWSLEEVANCVETAFEQHYTRTSDQPDGYQSMMLADKEMGYEWYREGEESKYAIMNALNSSEGIAEDLQLFLEERHSDFESAQIGEECEFDSEAHYEEIMPSDGEWHEEWRRFEAELKQQTRFFSQSAHATLTSIFGGIENMHTGDGNPIIVEAGPDCEITAFFRARVFYSDHDLEKAMGRPDQELGPPPSKFASAGRMNAHGISVFYGADTAQGALAEVRPPVGSQTLMGRFELVRPVRLLDFSSLKVVSEAGSIFDPQYADRLSKMMFLRSLRHRISRPVMPTDEVFDYLPTQAVIDFLANGLGVELDGVLFPSAQTNEETTNVVLFHGSSFVEQLDIPEGTEIDASTHVSTEDGPERDYSVYERTPPVEAVEEAEEAPKYPNFANFAMLGDYDDAPEKVVTLRLDLDSLAVHHINSATYDTADFSVSRHRYEKPAREPF